MHPKWLAGFLNHQQVLPICETYFLYPIRGFFQGGRVTDPGTVQMRRGSLEDERTSDFLFYSILVDVCAMDLVCFD